MLNKYKYLGIAASFAYAVTNFFYGAQMDSLILVDGSSFLYRAYHVSKGNFSTSSGIPTGVALIITRMLQNLIKKFAQHKIIVVFDAKGKSFRNEIYAEYKANRPPMPDELRIQIDYVYKIVKALGLPLVSIQHVEADDVLGTYAKEAEKQGYKVVICTGDKDLSQLVNANISLYNTMNEKVYDERAVEEKYGVKPKLIIDLLALKGDSSDNIPGMKGCGDKTALALLNGIGGIDEIVANTDKIASLGFRGAKNFASKFIDALEDIRLSYTLATIKTDVIIDLPISNVNPPVADKEQLYKLFKELEFNKLAQDLKKDDTATVIADSAEENVNFKENKQISDYKISKFTTIDNLDSLNKLVKGIKRQKVVAIDTETTSLKAQEATLVGISFALCEYEGFYLPLAHSYLGVGDQLDIKEVISILNPLFADEEIKFIGHNLKYDLQVLFFNGFTPPKAYADTMIMAYLLDSYQSVSLDELALKYLNYKNISYDEMTLNGRKRISFSEVLIEKATIYSGEDAEVTLRLYGHLKELLFAIDKLKKIFFEVDMPMLMTLFHMEIAGVLVDAHILASQNEVLVSESKKLQEQIYIAAGHAFNISSPKQLAEVLFEELAIPYPKKVKSGKNYSTAEDILQQIAPNYDIANLVLRYRELQKLISTYTEKLQTQISDKTGRIHSSFNQTGTITGRLSSNDPNLQNIPARTQEGKLIRKAFIAPQGYSLISADYSQIELRLIAHISGDEALIKAFNLNQDIHKATAAEVLGKDISEVTAQERSNAKATNFGLMYGMGAFKLANQTGMSVDEARSYIQKYFSRYPKVQDYMEKTRIFAHKHGYVETLLGRRISTPNINSSNTMMQKGAERAAINAPMQGSAADIIKLAMIQIDKWISSLNDDCLRMTIQVHDELLFEVRNDFVDQAVAKIREIMENVVALKVPLTVGIGVASNWGDAH